MRGFHVSWISFFLAFFCWFSITPLLSTIKEPEPVGIGISKEDVWTSSIVAVCGTIVMRLALGPMCDKVRGSNINYLNDRFLTISAYRSMAPA